MSTFVPIGLLAVVSLAGAVVAAVKASSHDASPAQRSWFWVVATVLLLVGLAAAFCAWWLWRFVETFTF